MNNLDAFNGYLKPKEKEKPRNNRIIGYTRVSSKDQLKNYSIKEQETEILAFAKRHKYDLIDIRGKTYESARGDFTRKEFTELLNLVKKSKPRPYAIAIRTINRFSRSGASAITIVHELVEKLGVHLIETSTGLCTEDLNNRATIYHRLLEAMEENQERLAITIPGMKKFLKLGYWLGVAPFGYSAYGPRVTDFSRRREEQEIVINDEGKVLQKAWHWKLQGERDCVIIKKMDELGVSIRKQKLSAVWDNPFYCGVIINNLLDEPVQGRWEPMVSQKEFFRVQQLLNRNIGASYKVDNANDERPLSRFLICSECGHQLTGYEAKKKKLHYYKCNICTGVSFNANTTKRSLHPGLNDTFLNLLQKVSLQTGYVEPFKLQLRKLFSHLHADSKSALKVQSRLREELDGKLSKLEEKYLFDDIDKELYFRHKRKVEEEKQQNSTIIAELEDKLSNHHNFIDNAVQVVQNISRYWDSGTLESKQRIQKVVFPHGIVLNPKNRSYLTNNMNCLFLITITNSENNENWDKKKSVKTPTCPVK